MAKIKGNDIIARPVNVRYNDNYDDFEIKHNIEASNNAEAQLFGKGKYKKPKYIYNTQASNDNYEGTYPTGIELPKKVKVPVKKPIGIFDKVLDAIGSNVENYVNTLLNNNRGDKAKDLVRIQNSINNNMFGVGSSPHDIVESEYKNVGGVKGLQKLRLDSGYNPEEANKSWNVLLNTYNNRDVKSYDNELTGNVVMQNIGGMDGRNRILINPIKHPNAGGYWHPATRSINATRPSVYNHEVQHALQTDYNPYEFYGQRISEISSDNSNNRNFPAYETEAELRAFALRYKDKFGHPIITDKDAEESLQFDYNAYRPAYKVPRNMLYDIRIGKDKEQRQHLKNVLRSIVDNKKSTQGSNLT